MSHRCLRQQMLVFILLSAVGGCVKSPSIFRPRGLAAQQLATLGWGYTIIPCVVLLIVCVLLLVALFRHRMPADSTTIIEERTRAGLRWIVIGGVIIPAVILTASFVFAVVIQADVANPPKPPVATIEIIGHRWWWEIRYITPGSNDTVVTANEIHVPVGQPVRLNLASVDVIHSFWVPELAGKTDLIPGQENTMWMEADHPGTYHGQCAEYCGLQHAHMAFVVDADSPQQYQRWLAQQRRPATQPVDSVAKRGLAVFQSASCAGCHAIRGMSAFGNIGPDLTHLATRSTIAAGLLSNTRGNLAGWIADAQGLKPGSGMPQVLLAARDLGPLLTYLETLK